MKIDSFSNQLRWVILLLAVAVVLPTVCLLWFMSQAVKNERLAVRQKLIDMYQGKLSKALKKLDIIWEEDLRYFNDELADSRPLDIFDSLTGFQYAGAIVYDESGKRTYPVLTTDMSKPLEPVEIFEDAWRLEFSGQYFAAAQIYEQKADSNDDYVHLSAIIGKSRCLAKVGKLNEAIETCKKAAFSPAVKQCDVPTLTLIANARLFLTELLNKSKQSDNDLLRDTFIKVLDMLHEENEVGSFLPSNQRIFMFHKTIDIYNGSSYLKSLPRGLHEEGIRKRIAAEELSIRSIDHFPAAGSFEQWHWPQSTVRMLDLLKLPLPVYGVYYKIGDDTALCLISQKYLRSRLKGIVDNTEDALVNCVVLDNFDHFAAGSKELIGKPFVNLSMGKYMPEWTVRLYFKDPTVVQNAAIRQTALYIWIGMLVIVLIFAAGGFAGQAVGRQIKLNRLKNDFIATVSHELKTPLASMRVLVDTLLEGNYKDQKQATEYLQLTAKENERLSRLIDNFLTFSRMERNKQAFEIVKTSPATIARAAAEVVKTKFSKGRCEFEVKISEDLPDVLADRDAIVTVLVNLLDNAYKYSYDDKHIELRVFTEDGLVCFSVVDNGVGMSRRAAKKIFNRFYQLDRSLSRRAGGCGLGLSIAKFIVDAHKGSISVDSKPGEGSTFTVELPAVN